MPWKLYLYFELRVSKPTAVQIYTDMGDGYSELESHRIKINSPEKFKSLKFKLPIQGILGIRVDPLVGPGTFSIRNIAFIDEFHNPIKMIHPGQIKPNQDINQVQIYDDILEGQTTVDGDDPSMILDLDYPVQYASIYPLYKRVWTVIKRHENLK